MKNNLSHVIVFRCPVVQNTFLNTSQVLGSTLLGGGGRWGGEDFEINCTALALKVLID